MQYDPSSPVIVLITRNCRLSCAAMQSSLEAAEGLNGRIVVVFVNTWPFLWNGGLSESCFREAALRRIELFRQLATNSEITVSHILETGKISKVIHRLCRLVRKLDFIILDQDIPEETAFSSTVPVFMLTQSGQEIVRVLSCDDPGKTSSQKPTLTGHTATLFRGTRIIIQAVILALIYTKFCTDSNIIMKYWTMGGCYGFLPPLTAGLCFALQYDLIERCRLLPRLLRISRPQKVKDSTFIYEHARDISYRNKYSSCNTLSMKR